MNFIKRAFKNVTRKPSKSILLIITFFLIGNLVIIGLGIASASDNAKILTRKKMRAVVDYTIDYRAIEEYYNSLTDMDEIEKFEYPSIKVNDVKDLMNDERINTANAIIRTMFYPVEGFDYVHLNNSYEQNSESSYDYRVDEDGIATKVKYIEPTYFVKANFFPNMIELVDNELTLTSGNFYTQDDIDNYANVCLITNALAQVNNLHIGDTISFYLTSPSELQYYEGANITLEDITVEYEIIGLFDSAYQITPDNSYFDWTSPNENPNNMILMPATSYYMSSLTYTQKIDDYYYNLYGDDYYIENRPTEDNIGEQSIGDVTFLLSDPLDVDSFVEDYSDKLPQFIMLDPNNEEFNRLSKPLDTLNLYANFIVILVLVNAVVIITLVTALTLKTREYEIGVLLSIGATKLKVIGQFFIELALVAIIGFSLSIASGSLIAHKVGETVLEYQIQESDINNDNDDYLYDDYYSIWNNDYSTQISIDDLTSEYSVSISPLIIAEIYVLGLGIVLVSIIIPSMMIMRFNPKKILMNQY